jgi:hypothetical protein
LKTKTFFTKLTQWEHWPTPMFYIPVLPYAFYQAAKVKSLTFFLNTNPAIKNSGDGTESKYKTICLVPKEHRPKSVLIPINEKFDIVLDKISNEGIIFPLIAKPDLGFRGLLVKKINSENDLKIYLEKNKSIEILFQEFLDYKEECGILYHRLPNKESGKITSITLKKFLEVIGDGKSTLAELILTDERAFLYFDLLKNIHQEKMKTIPEKDKKIILTVIGNHSKGTQFLNGNHLINKKLEQTFDNFNKKMDGWYFGRLDIKYNDFEKLIQGEDFKVLEINGILAEPTHIYDASVKGASYFKAIKAIKNNWKAITQIAVQNRENKSLTSPKPVDYIRQMRELRQYAKKLTRLNKLN